MGVSLVALLRGGVIPEQLKLKDVQVFLSFSFSHPGNERSENLLFGSLSAIVRIRGEDGNGGAKGGKREKIERRCLCMQHAAFEVSVIGD